MNKNQPFKDLLKNRNFVKLWVSQILSQMSINLMNFYVVTRIFSLTSSSTAVSLMWIAGALPCLLFAPFSGPVVDGVSKRKSMIVTNLLQASSISLLFFVVFGGLHISASLLLANGHGIISHEDPLVRISFPAFYSFRAGNHL